MSENSEEWDTAKMSGHSFNHYIKYPQCPIEENLLCDAVTFNKPTFYLYLSIFLFADDIVICIVRVVQPFSSRVVPVFHVFVWIPCHGFQTLCPVSPCDYSCTKLSGPLSLDVLLKGSALCSLLLRSHLYFGTVAHFTFCLCAALVIFLWSAPAFHMQMPTILAALQINSQHPTAVYLTVSSSFPPVFWFL